MTNEQQKLLNRLLKRRVITEDGCWLYVGPSGVAKKEIYAYNNNRLVHRIAAFVFYDFNIFSWNLICHKCKTKNCWNPEHLYVGNTSSNTRDSIKDGTFRNMNTDKTHCINGHELAGSNLYIWKDKKTKQIHRWCKVCRCLISEKYKSQ